MPNYLQIPVIDGIDNFNTCDFGRDLVPGDVFMVAKSSIIDDSSIPIYANSKGISTSMAISVCSEEHVYSIGTYPYSDYVFLVVLNGGVAMAPFCKLNPSSIATTPFIPSDISPTSSVDFNDYNCTALMVELSGDGTSFTGEIPGVTELVDGLFFIGKVPANARNAMATGKSIDINGLGAHNATGYKNIGVRRSTAFGSESTSRDTYYPFLYYEGSWYCLSESLTYSSTVEKG